MSVHHRVASSHARLGRLRRGAFRSSGWRRLAQATSAMLLMLSFSSLGYYTLGQLYHRDVLRPHLAEPWNLFECLYMSVVTVSTIGYGETLPVGVGQDLSSFELVRGFNLVVILLGMVLVGFSVSSATAFLIEGDLLKYWQQRRALREAAQQRDHYVVCGGGVTGTVVLDELVDTHHPVVVIEKDPARAEQIRERYPSVAVLIGDATEDQVLLDAGLEHAAGLAAALPSDRDNVFLIVTARRIRRDPALRIVSLASDKEVREKLEAAGAQGVVAASHIGGLRLASELFRPAVVGFLDVMLRGRSDAVRFAEISLDARWAGKSVAELELATRDGLPVLALQHTPGGEYVFNPAESARLSAATVVVTMGEAEAVGRAASRLGS